MRPDIDAGPIGRKCSASNGPLPGEPAGAAACSDRPTSDCAPNAAINNATSMKGRKCLIATLQGIDSEWCELYGPRGYARPVSRTTLSQKLIRKPSSTRRGAAPVARAVDWPKVADRRLPTG